MQVAARARRAATTAITALTGSATSTPTKPNRWPNANSAKITASGFMPMRSPTRLRRQERSPRRSGRCRRRRSHRDRPVPAGELQQRRRAAPAPGRCRSRRRDEDRQAGEDADRHREVEADERQADAVVRRQHQHHQQLAAQVLAEHDVAFVDERRRRARRRGGTRSTARARPAAASRPAGRTAPPAPGSRCRRQRQHDAAADARRAQRGGEPLVPVGVEVLEDERLEARDVER